MILNQYWPRQEAVIDNEEDLIAILSEGTYPRTLKEKLDRLFMHIIEVQTCIGERIDLQRATGWGSVAKHYLKNEAEIHFCFQILEEEGLIEIVDRDFKGFNIRIPFKGLQYGSDLTHSGKNSLNCFIAMSFGVEMGSIRATIRKTVEGLGYVPILIDEVLIDSDQTINDAILSHLKGAKFCIADFTEQKDGVYFESGYALGRGLPVIYTCQKDWFAQTHFDTNHFPHIVYGNEKELEVKLINRIRAMID